MISSITAQEFVLKWINVELKEWSAAQEHFIDVCHLIVHITLVEKKSTN
jgi:hypothetical protein